MKKTSLDQQLKRFLKPKLREMESAGDRVWRKVSSATESGLLPSAAPVRFKNPFPPAMLLATSAVILTIVFAISLQNKGRTLHSGETIRSGDQNGIMFALADGSWVEMRAGSEVSVEQATDGMRLRLNNGSILVNAAKQRTGHLYVQTKDVMVSVVGTVFMVNAEEQGSRVSVIEGEVRVKQGNIETNLHPGEHVSTAPTAEPRAVKEEIAWSPKALEHLALLQQSQPPAPPEVRRRQFEEASIRPCTPQNPPPGARGGGNGGGRLEVTPGRLFAPCMTVADLIEASQPLVDPIAGFTGLSAGLKTKHVRGGPEWISTDRYTVEAITDGATDVMTITNVMLAELLERRLQIKVHLEAEQVPALALVIAPGGLKIKPFQEGDCEREKKTKFPNPKPRCGMVIGDFNGPNWRWEQGSATLGSLTALGLSTALRVPVIDRTGTTEKFALILEYAIDESTPGLLGWCEELTQRHPENPPNCLGRPTAPSIHTALSQFGLKVEPYTASREFIVVDRVERPTPN